MRQRHHRPDKQKPLESSISAGSKGFFFLRWLSGRDKAGISAAAEIVLP
jgi:hypothetical protein